MELSKYLETIKKDKKELWYDLTLAILKLENNLTVSITDKQKVISQLKNIVDVALLLMKDNKIDINSDANDLDLDYVKNNIHIYQSRTPHMTNVTFLFQLKNALIMLIENKKDKAIIKTYLFEIITKTFLFIDYNNLSIDVILGINHTL